jgi:hypothetical protein
MSKMRQIRSPDGNIGPVKDQSLPISGVYKCERDLNNALIRGMSKNMPGFHIDSIFNGSLLDNNDIVMTHRYFHPRNIITENSRSIFS